MNEFSKIKSQFGLRKGHLSTAPFGLSIAENNFTTGTPMSPRRLPPLQEKSYTLKRWAAGDGEVMPEMPDPRPLRPCRNRPHKRPAAVFSRPGQGRRLSRRCGPARWPVGGIVAARRAERLEE